MSTLQEKVTDVTTAGERLLAMPIDDLMAKAHTVWLDLPPSNPIAMAARAVTLEKFVSAEWHPDPSQPDCVNWVATLAMFRKSKNGQAPYVSLPG